MNNCVLGFYLCGSAFISLPSNSPLFLCVTMMSLSCPKSPHDPFIFIYVIQKELPAVDFSVLKMLLFHRPHFFFSSGIQYADAGTNWFKHQEVSEINRPVCICFGKITIFFSSQGGNQNDLHPLLRDPYVHSVLFSEAVSHHRGEQHPFL